MVDAKDIELAQGEALPAEASAEDAGLQVRGARAAAFEPGEPPQVELASAALSLAELLLWVKRQPPGLARAQLERALAHLPTDDRTALLELPPEPAPTSPSPAPVADPEVDIQTALQVVPEPVPTVRVAQRTARSSQRLQPVFWEQDAQQQRAATSPDELRAVRRERVGPLVVGALGLVGIISAGVLVFATPETPAPSREPTPLLKTPRRVEPPRPTPLVEPTPLAPEVAVPTSPTPSAAVATGEPPKMGVTVSPAPPAPTTPRAPKKAATAPRTSKPPPDPLSDRL